ncbi:hypothetical protein [Methylobacterium mesophilicum]
MHMFAFLRPPYRMENLRQVPHDVVTLRRSRASLGSYLSWLGTLGHFH